VILFVYALVGFLFGLALGGMLMMLWMDHD
jgi:hypothetical protein